MSRERVEVRRRGVGGYNIAASGASCHKRWPQPPCSEPQTSGLESASPRAAPFTLCGQAPGRPWGPQSALPRGIAAETVNTAVPPAIAAEKAKSPVQETRGSSATTDGAPRAFLNRYLGKQHGPRPLLLKRSMATRPHDIVPVGFIFRTPPAKSPAANPATNTHWSIYCSPLCNLSPLRGLDQARSGLVQRPTSSHSPNKLHIPAIYCASSRHPPKYVASSSTSSSSPM